MNPWLTLIVVGLGGSDAVVSDPFEGAVITSEQRAVLPSGRSTSSIVDLWLCELENLNPGGGGGLDRFDRLRLSSHGRSWTQTRYFVDGIEITDPARPGAPLIAIPYQLWRRMVARSLWTAEPGLHFEIGSGADRLKLESVLVGGGAVGGGTWIPRGVMDREPAIEWGADTHRRAQRRGAHLTASASTATSDVAIELVEDVHAYPTLKDALGARLEDRAGRMTLTGGHRGRLGAAALDARLLWQREDRNREGAQWRHPDALTVSRESDAVVGLVRARWQPTSRTLLEARAGMGWRRDEARPRDSGPRVADIEGEWSWMQRPELPGRAARSRLDGSLDWTRMGAAGERPLRLHLRASDSRISRVDRVSGGIAGRSYGRAGLPTERGVSMTVYGPAAELGQRLQSLRAQVDGSGVLGSLQTLGTVALDYGRAAGAGPLQVEHLTPAVGAAARWRSSGGWEAFVLVRREPLSLTAEVSDFVDADAPAGRTFRWHDDGDGIPEASEAGALLARTGGGSHSIDPGLRRPTSNHLAMGFRSVAFGPFEVLVTGVARVLADRWTVRMAGPAAASYEPVELIDPGGDGLGESTPKGQPQRLTVYARRPGTEGEEIYELTNARQPNAYIGSEIQLRTVGDRSWFVSLGAKGYWNLGAAPFGLFADRNDPGVIDEITADPNARVNQRGRIDADRAFGINLLTAWMPLEGLSLAAALRYRDGEPMTRIIVAEQLPQGPTPIMAVPRGDPVPRFTFHMTLDLRVRYRVVLDDLAVTGTLDVHNLLGSGTEILEDVRTGTGFRRSLEMVPGRTVYVGLGGEWAP